MDYIYIVPHVLVMLVFSITLRIKNEMFKKERIERIAAFKRIDSDGSVGMEKDGDESLNTLVGRNLYIERMMNSQMIGSYLAVSFFSAGGIYGNTSTGLLLLPSIGVFLLFANVIFLGEEQVFRVIKQRKLERLSERYPSLMCVRKVGSKWYYRYLLLLVVVGGLNFAIFYAAAVVFY